MSASSIETSATPSSGGSSSASAGATGAGTARATSTSGQGRAVFEWEEDLTSCFPEAARPFEKDMHGGFNEDPATGIVYTGIPGYGLCSISPDLRTWKRIGEEEGGDEKKDSAVLAENIHGLVVFEHGGEKLLALAQNNAEQVVIVTLDGTVRQVIGRPTGQEFYFQEANDYYSEHNGAPRGTGAGYFKVTDVTFLNGTLFVVTGYCPGDFVLTLRPDADNQNKWIWGPVAWGGKGDEPGKFRTAHGVYAHDGHIFVANREAHQVVKFTSRGHLVRVLPGIPSGSRVCNISHAERDDYLLLNPLAPVTPEQRSAPIYAYADDHIFSTIIPGDLGIPVLRHCHHVWPHYISDGTGGYHLHLLVHGWNVGKFAVLKQHRPAC